MSFDDIGRGEEEGVSNVRAPSEAATSKSLEVLKQVASAGYTRGRVPQELVVLPGGVAVQTDSGAVALDGSLDASTALETLAPEPSLMPTTAMDARTKAKMQGYEGEACGECGNYTLVRNGTCMKCNTCGATSGCS